MQPLVIAVGNPLAGDDALGYCTGLVLERCTRGRDFDIIVLQALEPGVAAYFEGRELVVFVDAVDPGVLPEGAKIAVIEVDPTRLSVEELAETLMEISSHESNPINIALIARASGLFDGRVVLVTPRAYRLELREGLSEDACRLLPRVAAKVLEVLGSSASIDEGCAENIAGVCGCK